MTDLDEAITLWEAKYNADQLRDMLAKGHAIRNDKGEPSYPIGDAEDLQKAIRAVGRGGAGHDKIRAYIIRRAKALGKSDMIPDNWSKSGAKESEALAESTTLTEAVRGQQPTGGRMRIKLIDAGWGSSGYYSPAVLAEAAKNGVFPAGTHMYLDHPSATESMDRPERSVRDLAAVLTSPATFDQGALYAEARVFGPFQQLLSEQADAIGVSIRAAGTAEYGEADGRDGMVVTALTEGLSVDFVTKAGRGGAIVSLLEAARAELHEDRKPAAGDDEPGEMAADVSEAAPELPAGTPPPGDHPLNEGKQMSGNTPTGAPNGGATNTKPADIAEAESRVKALETELAEARERLERRSDSAARLEEAERENGKLRDEVARFRALESVRTTVAAELAESGLPETAYARVTASVVGHEGVNIPMTEAGAVDAEKLKTVIEAAIKSEKTYVAGLLEAAGVGSVRGLGESAGAGDVTDEQADKELAEAMKGLGMSEAATRVAVTGRG